MTPTAEAVRHARAWARAALQLEAGLEPALPQPGSQSDADLVAAVLQHRLVDLIEPRATELRMPERVADELSELRRQQRVSILRHRLELGRVKEVLADVEWLSIKGPALAVQTTGDPAARGSGDIDVFVDPGDVEQVVHVLATNGWRPRLGGSAPSGSWARRYLQWTYNEMTFDGPHSTVDLHWRLDPSASALPDFPTAWSRRESITIGDLTLETLGLRDAFSHTCLHAEKDGWRWLRSLVDVHRLARLDELWSATRTTPLGPSDRRALAVTAASLGLPPAVARHLPDGAGGSPRLIHRSLTIQEHPLGEPHPPPGSATWRFLRYRLTVSRRGADFARALANGVLPGQRVYDLDDRTAWTGLPRAVGRRVAHLLRRVLAWVRPGADVRTRRAAGER